MQYSAYPPSTQTPTKILPGDLILFCAIAGTPAEYLLTFADLVASVEAIFNRKLKVTHTSADINPLDDTYAYVVADAVVTLTLPLAASYPGQQYVFTNASAGDLTLAVSGGDTIMAGLSYVIPPYCTIAVISGGPGNCWSVSPAPAYGATAQRPTAPGTGFQYFDTDLGYPIWYDSTQWVDATGTPV